MATVAGVFNSTKEAESAFLELQSQAGFREEDLVLLSPGTSQAGLNEVPTTEGEQPGMGKALGGVVGGAVGLSVGSVVASLILPGVGSILAVGLGAGALGVGGALAGAAGGGAMENQLSGGLPKDELFFYEDALKQCRTVVIGTSTDNDTVEKARAVMERHGAESIDAARERWWIGLRDAEEVEYGAPEEFRNHESTYRCGFEAALHPDFRNQPQDAAAEKLRERFPDVCKEDAFRRGYERGRVYYSNCRGTGSQ